MRFSRLFGAQMSAYQAQKIGHVQTQEKMMLPVFSLESFHAAMRVTESARRNRRPSDSDLYRLGIDHRYLRHHLGF
jgi:hypothetical protein